MSHKPESGANDPMAVWMRRLSNDPPERSHRPLPDPDLLWMKAQLLDRQAARESSLKLVRWFEAIARVLVILAAYWLAIGLVHVLGLPEWKSLNPTLVGLAVSMVLAAVAMLAFPIWSED